MTISPIYCPDPSCFWSAHGIPDECVEARDWHLAAHRADVHGVQPTPEQVAYATKAGHVIPGTARTADDAVAVLGALPVPGDPEPQALSAERLAEIAERTPKRAAALTAWLNKFSPVDGQRALENAETVLEQDVPALLAEVQHLRQQQSLDDAEYEQATAEIQRLKDELAEQTRYALHLETTICQCDPACEDGEYLHVSDCPVAEVQMRMLDCPGFEDNPVAPNLCAGCHEPREDHEATTNPAPKEAS